MPLELKKQLDLSPAVDKAARRRVSDQPHTTVDERQVDQASRAYLEIGNTTLEPSIRPGGVLTSSSMRTFVKDSKFLVGSLAEQSQLLEDQIIRAAEQGFATLDDIRRQVGELDSVLKEEEIRILQSYTQTHFNQFTRSEDLGLDWQEDEWLLDYGNGKSFLANEVLVGQLRTGLTLPLVKEQAVPIHKVKVVWEESDRGDSREPVLSSSVTNLLLKDEVFRHVIIKQQHDETTRRYARSAAHLTLMVSFSCAQVSNLLTLKKLGHSKYSVQELIAINDLGAEVTLDYVSAGDSSELALHYSPVRTRHLKIVLQQDAPVSTTEVTLGDTRELALNEVLAGAGFTEIYNPVTETIKGRVFDFSAESLEVSLRTYSDRGIFRSRPLSVSKPAGVALENVTDHISFANALDAFGEVTGVTPGILVENYLGVTLVNKDGGSVVDELVPVPDSYPLQTEALPLSGDVSRLKLYPNLHRDITAKVKVKSAQWVGASGLWSVETETPHGMLTGDTQWALYGPADSGFNGIPVSVTVPSPSFVNIVPPVGITSPSHILESHFPAAYIFDWQAATTAQVFRVFQDQTELTIGTDYEVSPDGGSEWYSYLPVHRQYPYSAKQQAGRFMVKIVNPNIKHRYSVSYRVSDRQDLVPSGEVMLRNGRVVFGAKAMGSSGTLSAVLAFRGSAINPYLTPILRHFTLKIREV